MSENSRVQEIMEESAILGELTLTQILHPELGELVLIKESGGVDGEIQAGEKLKIIEMAKLFIGAEILSKLGEIE